jgi:hypothetical protein
MAEEQENIPIELTIRPSGSPSVASVAAAAMAVMPENAPIAVGTDSESIKKMRTIKPKARAGAVAAIPAVIRSEDPKTMIKRMKRDLEEGRRRLKPEEINNPFSKEFNKLLLKKELLEREMTIHDIGILPIDGDGESEGQGADVAAAAAALTGLYPTLNDPNFNTKIALRKEFFDTKMDVDHTKNVEEEAEILCNAQIELAPNQQFVRNFLSVETRIIVCCYIMVWELEKHVPQLVLPKRCGII